MKRSGTYKLLLLSLSICYGITSYGQAFTAAVDRDKILIGEQINLVLKVDGLKAGENFIRNWIVLPDSINHIEVVERSKMDTIEVGKDITFQQTITITSFDSGQWQLPPIKLAVESRAGYKYLLSSQPITVNVLPVDVSQLQDYHDIKDIVEVENDISNWILIGIIAIVLISLIAIFILSGRKQLRIEENKILKGNQTPLEWALSSIDKLQKQELPLKGQVKQYYLQLSTICRQFFQMQLQQKSLYQTSDEWMIDMQPLPVSPETKTSFFQFIRLADAVKFAKFLPSTNEYEQSSTNSKQMLTEVAYLPQLNSATAKTTTI